MAAGGESDILNVFESDRQNLMKHLLDAVKQCQVQFSGKKELATEKDSCVQCLLAQFENAFLHGLKRGKVWGAINSLSEPLRHVPGIKVLSGIPEAEITFWPFLKENMPPSEIQRYMSMKEITTDSGRCRCWLRSCLNESSLERHLIDLLSRKGQLRQFYEEWALFLDEERSSTLPDMARGLGFIVFAISTGSSQMNAPLKLPPLPRENMALAPVTVKSTRDPLSAVTTERKLDHAVVKKKRKKKVKQATIEEVVVPEDEPPSGAGVALGKARAVQDVIPKADERVQGIYSLSQQIEKLEDNDNALSTRRDNEGGERSSIKAHRRATSLESSEIIRHKKGLFGYDSQEPNDFEVPSFGHTPKQSASVENVGTVGDMGKVASDKNFMASSSVGISDHTNILSKLANLGSSFKTSFSTGFAQSNIVKKEKESSVEKVENQIKNNEDDIDSLFADDEDVFTVRGKLEVCEESHEGSPLKSQTNFNDEPALSLDRDFYPDISQNDKRRTSSEELGAVLLEGLPLPSQKIRVPKKEAIVTSTPPPTPADSTIAQRKVSDISSVGLEERLKDFKDHDGPQDEAISDMERRRTSTHEAEADGNGAVAVKEEVCKIDDDKADSASVSSSNTGSVYEDFDVMQPVGFESEKFDGMVLTYDRQSSQAANDMMKLLRTSADMELTQDKVAEKTESFNHGSNGRPHLHEKKNNSTDSSDLSTAELKQAILATVKRKEEVEERNRVLKLALDEERESNMSLGTEVERLKERLMGVQETSGRQLSELSRENEVLRNQLKKYVTAVQLLRRESKSLSEDTKQAISTLRGYDDDSSEVLPPPPKERTDSEMDSIYEEKLIQMAQLHGELMEFHESLQRDLMKKQQIIASMKDELVSLRGPLPENADNLAQGDVTESYQTRQLINVWIPSVFIKGKGSDAHHLYQIYIRIRDEEWNIYRRYSQFHKIHVASCKNYPEIEKINFPPKKILGKKDLKFVEGRRKKLQEYIRRYINVILAQDLSLAEHPSKENLEKSLPFFSDEYNNDTNKTKEKTKKKQKKSSVYTGL